MRLPHEAMTDVADGEVDRELAVPKHVKRVPPVLSEEQFGMTFAEPDALGWAAAGGLPAHGAAVLVRRS